MRRTLATLPLSLPVITCTMSSLRMFISVPPGRSRLSSDDLGRQADDLRIVLAKLAGHGPEDAGAARVVVVLVQDDHGVPVEADVAAVLATAELLGPDDHALDHVARLDVGAGDRLLDAGDDRVPQPRVAPPGAAEDLDAHRLFGAGVVGDIDV